MSIIERAKLKKCWLRFGSNVCNIKTPEELEETISTPEAMEYAEIYWHLVIPETALLDIESKIKECEEVIARLKK